MCEREEEERSHLVEQRLPKAGVTIVYLFLISFFLLNNSKFQFLYLYPVEKKIKGNK